MGFASGMQAGMKFGQGLRQSWDTYQVEKDIEAAKQKSAEKQFAIDREGIKTGLTAQQQADIVMPQAPSISGLSAQDQLAAINVGAGPSSPALGAGPSQTGMTPEQMAGLMQQPTSRGSALNGGQYQVMSEAAEMSRRADMFRARGQYDLANDLDTRAMALREEQRSIEDTAFNRGLETKKVGLDERRVASGEKLTDARVAEMTTQNEILGYQVKDLKAQDAMETEYKKFIEAGGSPLEAADQKWFQSASPELQDAFAGKILNVDKQSADMARSSINKAFDEAGSLQGMVDLYSKDKNLTPGVDYELVNVPGSNGADSGRVMIMRKDANGENGQIVYSGNPQSAEVWLRKQAEGGGVGAAYYDAERKAVNALAVEYSQQQFDNEIDRAKARTDFIGMLMQYGDDSLMEDNSAIINQALTTAGITPADYIATLDQIAGIQGGLKTRAELGQ